MQSAVTQIKVAYEQEGMTVEEIASDLKWEIGAVKGALANSSSKYRKACGMENEEEDDLNFTADQLRQVNNMIFQLAIGSEDEHVRTKNCHYIRDDKKGRKEVVRHLANNNTFNILNFNEQLKSARDVASRLKEKLVTDVQTE